MVAGPHPAALVLVVSAAVVVGSLGWSGGALVRAGATATALADRSCPAPTLPDVPGGCPTTTPAVVERVGRFGRRDVTARYLFREDPGDTEVSTWLPVDLPAQPGRGTLLAGGDVGLTTVRGEVTAVRAADGTVLRTASDPVVAAALHLPVLGLGLGGAVIVLGTVPARARQAGWWRRPRSTGSPLAPPGPVLAAGAVLVGLGAGLPVVYLHGPPWPALAASLAGAVVMATLLLRRRPARGRPDRAAVSPAGPRPAPARRPPRASPSTS